MYMVERLQLRHLDIGKIDSKHELIHGSNEENLKFIDSFLLPQNIDISKFTNTSHFEYHFIKGLKGTGKTCLLRYISLEIDKQDHSYSTFILFKSELKDYKSELAKSANKIAVVNHIDENSFDDMDENNIHTKEIDPKEIDPSELRYTRVIDYGILWDWIIHKKIVDTIEKENIDVFKKDLYWEYYSSCVKAIATIAEEKSRLIPIIKNGSIEISSNLRELIGVKLNLNISPSAKTIRFQELITKINRLYLNLSKGKENLYILFDELEPTPFPRKAYKRDVALIRDLISSINWFNISQGKNPNIFLIAAIRSEVLNVVDGLGKENNKLTHDFGIEISWKNPTERTVDHPLLKVLENRIKAAEKHYGYNEKQITQDVWKDYFPKQIDNIDIRKCIISHSWYRPRDIIRLLICAKNSFPYERMISQKVFKSIKADYSEESWKELCEELRLSYTSKELELIEEILNEYKREFSFEEITDHITNIQSTNKSFDDFLKTHSIRTILEDLYRVGVLGNVYWQDGKKRYSFIYNSRKKILLNYQIIIHKGLLPYFFIEESDKVVMQNKVPLQK